MGQHRQAPAQVGAHHQRDADDVGDRQEQGCWVQARGVSVDRCRVPCYRHRHVAHRAGVEHRYRRPLPADEHQAADGGDAQKSPRARAEARRRHVPRDDHRGHAVAEIIGAVRVDRQDAGAGQRCEQADRRRKQRGIH